MNPTNSGDLDINQKSPEEQAKTKVLSVKCCSSTKSEMKETEVILLVEIGK